jgi:hypothetical protein
MASSSQQMEIEQGQQLLQQGQMGQEDTQQMEIQQGQQLLQQGQMGQEDTQALLNQLIQAQDVTHQLLRDQNKMLAQFIQTQNHASWVIQEKISNIENRQCWATPDLSSVIRSVEAFARGDSWGLTPQCASLAAQCVKCQTCTLGQVKAQCDVRRGQYQALQDHLAAQGVSSAIDSKLEDQDAQGFVAFRTPAVHQYLVQTGQISMDIHGYVLSQAAPAGEKFKETCKKSSFGLIFL